MNKPHLSAYQKQIYWYPLSPKHIKSGFFFVVDFNIPCIINIFRLEKSMILYVKVVWIFRLIFLEDARQKRSEYMIFTSILTKQIQENHPENDKVYQYICFPPSGYLPTGSICPFQSFFPIP